MFRSALTVAAVAVLTCSAAAETYVVTAEDTSFNPPDVNVMPGDTVRWEYGSGYPHTVTSGTDCVGDGLFDAELDGGNPVFEWTVPDDAPDTIPYFCGPHCSMGMVGAIHVQGVGDGFVRIGIVDFTANSSGYVLNSDGTATMHVLSKSGEGGSFALGVEIQDNDVEVDVVASTTGSGVLYLHDPEAGTTDALTTGALTLLVDRKYMFHGDAQTGGFSFAVTWMEDGKDEGMRVEEVAVTGHCTLESTGDMLSMRAAHSGSILFSVTAMVDINVPMSVIANVTCGTLALPASGEEADVAMVAGTSHTIEINGDGAGMGMLLLNMGDDDDGGGGGCSSDVNGDGDVGVDDILSIIGNWGPCP